MVKRSNSRSVSRGRSSKRVRRTSVSRSTSSRRQIETPPSSYQSARRLLGGVAGGTLGYVTGGAAGAYVGAAAGRALSVVSERSGTSSKKNMRSTVNDLAGRASMKRVGSKKIKLNQKKKVKVPKKLKKQVAQIMAGKQVYGEYHKAFNGTIGCASITIANPTITVGSIGGVTAAFFPSSTATSSYNMSHWFIPLGVGANPSLAANYQAGRALVFFHPLKFLDAASVLWNTKASALDWTTEVRNLTTRANTTTGNPDQTVPAALKMRVINSYVEFEIKNTTQRAVTIVIRHCAPKLKAAVNYPIDTLAAGITSDTSLNGPLQFDSGNINDQVTSPIFNWNACPSFDASYKYETVSIIIKPGETCKHSLQGPKNYDYDFSKLFFNQFDATGYVYKGSVACVMSVIPDLQTASNTSNINSTAAYINSVVDQMNNDIGMVIKEHYKLSMPEPVGFIGNNAGAAGTGQPNNLRRNRKVFANFVTSNVDEAVLTYGGFDEEVPDTSILESSNY